MCKTEKTENSTKTVLWNGERSEVYPFSIPRSLPTPSHDSWLYSRANPRAQATQFETCRTVSSLRLSPALKFWILWGQIWLQLLSLYEPETIGIVHGFTLTQYEIQDDLLGQNSGRGWDIQFSVWVLETCFPSLLTVIWHQTQCSPVRPW